MTTTPKVLAYVRGNQMVLWCEYGQRFHFHGYDGDLERSTGDRVAHCADDEDSAYRQTGYVLEYAGRFDDLPEAMRRPRRTRRRRGPR